MTIWWRRAASFTAKNSKMKLLTRLLTFLLAAQSVSHSELVAEWRMNEPTGSIEDYSGNDLTGVPTAVALANNGLAYHQPSVPAGTYGAITLSAIDAAKLGTSIHFTRTASGMFQVGNPGVIANLASPGPSGTFTLMAWVHAQVSQSQNQRIFATGNPNGWGAGLSNVDQVVFTTFGVLDMRSTNQPSANNVWQHVAYVWNAGTVEVFVNGVSKHTAVSPNFNDETRTRFGIGGNAEGGDHFNGRIEDLKIFDTAMTKEEIIAAANPNWDGGPLLVLPATLNVANNGAPQQFTIPISNEMGTETLTVSAVTLEGVDSERFTVDDFTASIEPGASGTLKVSFTPPDNGLYQARLVIESNDGVSPVRTLPMSISVADPQIVPSVQRLDFGELAENPSIQSKTLTLTNDGGATPLEISTAEFIGHGGNGFSVVSFPESIAPGASGEIVIQFDAANASGDFSDLLYISSSAVNLPTLILPVVAKVAHVAAEKPVRVINGDFNAATWNSLNGTAPPGWTNSRAETPSNPSFYGQGGTSTPGGGVTRGLTSIAAHFQWVDGYYEQNLSAGNTGLTAGAVNTIAVAFDRFYRNDTYTNGHSMLRVSLWDKTNDLEIAGRDLVFEDTGVIVAGNQLTSVAFEFSYDASAYGDEEVALRISRVAPLYVNATLGIDNVSVSVDGDWVPASGYVAWALEKGLDGSAGKEGGTTDDPDQDGVSNFHEFAFGGNPLSADSGVLSAGASADTTGDAKPEWIITVAVRADTIFAVNSVSGAANGVDYEIEGSTNLAEFLTGVQGPLPATVLPTSLPIDPPVGYKYVSFRLAGSNGLPSKGFLRVKATAP
jgi:hypothetical protein